MLGEFYKLRNKFYNCYYKYLITLKYPNINFGNHIRIYGKLLIAINKSAKVTIRDNVIFRSATKYNFVGIYKPVSINVGKDAELEIGINTGFSGTSIVSYNKIIIGDYCNFGGNTAIWDTDFHPLEYRARRIHNVSQIKSVPIVIGDDVFVGANSIILKGVTIGDRVIIGAGSVVSKSIPANEIWAGNPAKFIKKIS